MGVSINRAEIGGYLGRDPETRKTTGGTSVATFNVAASERWKDKDGNEQEKTEWVRVVVWGKGADNCGLSLKKGSAVLVEGKISTREYEADGVKKFITEIVASRVHFLDQKGGGGGSRPGGDAPQHGDDDAPVYFGSVEDDLPF